MPVSMRTNQPTNKKEHDVYKSLIKGYMKQKTVMEMVHTWKAILNIFRYFFYLHVIPHSHTNTPMKRRMCVWVRCATGRLFMVHRIACVVRRTIHIAIHRDRTGRGSSSKSPTCFDTWFLSNALRVHKNALWAQQQNKRESEQW